ncbi:MAG: flippase-like domain-containing protein [Anaerolineae bacterium]|nr:flippase-like domain-containing protein [Anaerolineae bacterium]
MLYLTLRGLDWAAFFESLRRANYFYISLMLFWSSVTYFLRAMRWRVLLNSQKTLSLAGVFWANMAGYLGNNILPARAGEIIRAAYVARREKLPIVFVLATGFTERLVDLAALVVIGVLSVLFAVTFSTSMQEAFKSFAIVAVVGVAFIFLLPFFQSWVLRILHAIPFLKSSLKMKLEELFLHFVDGVKVIAQPRRGLPFLLFTILIWLMDGMGMVILAFSLNETLSLAKSFLLIAALGISSALPSTPGYVGVYQFVAVTILSPFGIARESALALILLVQFLNLLVVSVWGGLGLWLASRMVTTQKEDTHA